MVSSQRGFTLIGLVLVLFILALGLGAVTVFQLQVVTGKRESVTRDKLDKLKNAMLGNPGIISGGYRVSFGYLGPMGGLPPTLGDLWQRGNWPIYEYNSSLKIGVGWAGPYLDLGPYMDGVKLDEWGNEFEYNTTEYTKPDGTVISARIRSAGPDKVFSPDPIANPGDDMIKEIQKKEAFATVTGYVTNKGGNPGKYITLSLNIPVNGVVTKLDAQTDINGFFSIPNVPYGMRAFTVDPMIVYAEGSAQVKGGAYQNVVFSVSNFGAPDVTLTSMKLEYTATAYYEKVQIGAKTPFDYSKLPAPNTNRRNASGEVIDFSSAPIIIKGTRKNYPPTTVVVQEPLPDPSTVIVGTVGKNTTIKIQALNFRSGQVGGSPSFVNMTNVPFTVTFIDINNNTYTLYFTPT